MGLKCCAISAQRNALEAIAILGTVANIIEDKTGSEGFDPLKLRVGIALMLLMIFRPQGLFGDRREIQLEAR